LASANLFVGFPTVLRSTVHGHRLVKHCACLRKHVSKQCPAIIDCVMSVDRSAVLLSATRVQTQ
jgi:hypothetical protein